MTDVLAEYEQRVTAKLAAALPEWPVPDDPFGEWLPEPVPDLPADWPQWPLEQWVISPARRGHCLVMADVLIDRGELALAGWLVQYGGKERVA